MTTDQRLAELGIELPTAPAPAGNYVAAMQVGNLLYISLQQLLLSIDTFDRTSRYGG